MLTGSPRGGYAEESFSPREVEPFGAIGEQRRAGLLEVEAAHIDLAEVGNEKGLGTARAVRQLSDASEQIVVGQLTDHALFGKPAEERT